MARTRAAGSQALRRHLRSGSASSGSRCSRVTGSLELSLARQAPSRVLGKSRARLAHDQAAAPREPVGDSVLGCAELVGLEGMQPEVCETATALVTEQAVRVLVDDAVVAEAVWVTEVHDASMPNYCTRCAYTQTWISCSSVSQAPGRTTAGRVLRTSLATSRNTNWVIARMVRSSPDELSSSSTTSTNRGRL